MSRTAPGIMRRVARADVRAERRAGPGTRCQKEECGMWGWYMIAAAAVGLGVWAVRTSGRDVGRRNALRLRGDNETQEGLQRKRER